MSVRAYRYDGGEEPRLKDYPTDAPQEAKDKKEELIAKTQQNLEKIAQLQEKLYAAGEEALLVVIQARDAAGKDSLVKHVFGCMNPQGVTVSAFKVPSKEELAHDYLWRIHQRIPARGMVGVFNRSYYEDVVTVKVHHLEKTYRLAERCVKEDFFDRRYKQLRHYESYLGENGVRVLKLFLNVSQGEQRRRFLERMDLPQKHWKLSLGDLDERDLWDAYDDAFRQAFAHTATKDCPWYLIPADNKWYTRYLVSQLLADTLEDMNPQYPPLPEADKAKLPEAKARLGASEA